MPGALQQAAARRPKIGYSYGLTYDVAAAVAARRRIHGRGLSGPLLDVAAERPALLRPFDYVIWRPGYTRPMLLCSVRECRMPLERAGRRVFCPRGHSFDVARSGYINLLQPQDRRSREPGDAVAAVAARRRIHERGFTGPLLDPIAETIGASSADSVLDAGCGDGFYLGSLQCRSGCHACGVDISIPAIDAAARRYPACEWIVANADRFVPYADRSFSIVLSITGRMNAPEFRRVLCDGGRLLAAVPAPDDLIELRGRGRDRAARTIETFADGFMLTDQRRVTASAALDAAAVEDVLLAIYRPKHPRPAEAMQVTGDVQSRSSPFSSRVAPTCSPHLIYTGRVWRTRKHETSDSSSSVSYPVRRYRRFRPGGPAWRGSCGRRSEAAERHQDQACSQLVLL
jgi:23S rRNA (guanine745-N1)-methyltransferase